MIDDEQLKDMADSVIGESEPEAASYIGLTEFPFDGEEFEFISKKGKKDEGYVIFEKNVELISHTLNFKTYMNGIWVKEEKPIFPLMMLGTKFEYLAVNVKSREYSLNLARTYFDDKKANKKLWTNVLKLIYEDLQRKDSKDYCENPGIKLAINFITDELKVMA